MKINSYNYYKIVVIGCDLVRQIFLKNSVSLYSLRLHCCEMLHVNLGCTQIDR